MPIYAECGGFMALAEALVDGQGRTHPMAGLVPGRSRLTGTLQSFGYKRLTALQDTLFCPAGGSGLAHEFHHSLWEGEPPGPAWRAVDLQGEGGPAGVAAGNLLASYAHVHFGGNPAWARAWVGRMRAWQANRK
jgi:cobyrinic acid a,c-diamide synthase